MATATAGWVMAAIADGGQNRGDQDRTPRRCHEKQTSRSCLQRIRPPVAWHGPRHVHRVLQRLSHAERPIQRDHATQDDGQAAALQPSRLAKWATDDRKLTQRRLKDCLLQPHVAVEHEAKD